MSSKSIIHRLLTWWNGQTLNTQVWTALNGAQGETTTFTGLETFVNGSLDSTDAGLLTMIDETLPMRS